MVARKWHDPTPCRVRVLRRASPGVNRHFNHMEKRMRRHPARSHWPERTDPPTQPAESRAREPEHPHSTEPRPSPDRLRNRDAEILSDDSYRLAGAASGTGRSSGSLLDDAAATLNWSPEISYNDPERLNEVARQYRARTARAIALEDAAIEFNDAVRRAATVRRRIERRQETRLRRAEAGTTKNPRRPSRPVKVDVDLEAWEVVKRDGVSRRWWMGAVVGELVRQAVQDGVIPRNRPQQKSVQDSAGSQQPQQSSKRTHAQTTRQRAGQASGRLFARIFVDEETWAQFRVLAFDAHVPISRLVGLLVEREAHNIKTRENR